VSEKQSKFFKFLLKFFGFLLINFAITVVFFAFFANLSLQDIDTLKKDINSFILRQSGITEEQYAKIEEQCRINPNLEGCEPFNSNPVDKLVEQINSFKSYFLGALLIIIASFIIGFVFVFIAIGDLLITFHKISLVLAIQSFFAAFYYKFLPNILKYLLSASSFVKVNHEISPEVINEILNIIFNWLLRPLIKTFNLALIIGVIFLVITIILAKIRRKTLDIINKDRTKK